MSPKLFPTNIPELEWAEFPAAGFSGPVSGVVYRSDNSVVCGMPLGGISTGCLDLETAGTFGYCTIFNSHVPRRGPINLPFLGVNVDGKTWVLTTKQTRRAEGTYQHGGWITPKCNPLDGFPLQIEGVEAAEDIHYWGHYPIADLEYEIDAPVSVGLRAWSPFVPGDSTLSNTPGAVFEVHVRNNSAKARQITLAFSFPGPTHGEAQVNSFKRKHARGEFTGVAVTPDKDAPESRRLETGYALGVIGNEDARLGGELAAWGQAWQSIHTSLPETHSSRAGASVAVDLSLAPNEEKIVRFVVAWYSPEWKGGGTPMAGMNTYTHIYATRYKNALEVAKFLAHEHQSILRRIIAWQEVIYAESKLPVWLRDSLVNIFHLITETGFWAAAEPPIGDWCPKETGLFGMNEDPRGCPQMECVPCGFLGNVPLVYFFPDLALSELRGYKAYQQPNGQLSWVWGGHYNGGFLELAMPQTERISRPQVSTDGPSYVSMVDRLWKRAGDDQVLQEFYTSVKQNTIFTMNLCADKGPAGIISIPPGSDEWYELFINWVGMVSHIGGLHLAQLRIAERMAVAMGDTAFAEQCREWHTQGSRALEEQMWTGDYYLLYKNPATGEESDIILGYQLDGEWIARSEGLAGAFPPERVKTTLATVKRTAVAITDKGALTFMHTDGAPVMDEYHRTGEGGWSCSVAPVPTWILGMTYMYDEEKEFGLELVRRSVHSIMAEGYTWSQPNMFRGDTGKRVAGYDYYQNLMLWALPAAMANEPLHGPCGPGGLVARVLRASRAAAAPVASHGNRPGEIEGV